MVTVEVRIDAHGSGNAFGQLQVRQDFRIEAESFTELAAILGQFHELAQQVKADQAAELNAGD